MLRCFLLAVFILILHDMPGHAQNVSIIDGWYYVGSEKFFVKGIGYETHTRPGQIPWVYQFDPDLIRYDLARIKNAGFNTIRTWGAITEEELQLVEESGLKIMFGIWIDPGGDFSDPGFKSQALSQVNSVLNYTKSYQSIIAYLIMNEPLTEHIYAAGAQGLADLWDGVTDQIHQEHPGIPVSFSNTMIGDYIDMERFDMAGYNAYIYNPVTITRSHGYAGYLRFLKQNRSPDMPMIITEYGLSVSPGYYSPEYGYGGNTLEQQTDGDLEMYRGLIDAGAQGGCVFQYHDGWWKGGNENVHDPVAEEWFGLVGFASAADIYGTPRPVWNAYHNYNQAIITSPKNEQIYNLTVPLEIFTTDQVYSCTISSGDSVLHTMELIPGHNTSELVIAQTEEIRDYDLQFCFYDQNGDTLKTEQISILCAKVTPVLPSLDLKLIPATLTPGSLNYLDMKVVTNPVFTIEANKIDYVAHTHIGFDPGRAKSTSMTFINNRWSFVDNFDIPADVHVVTFGAGFTVRYGSFTKRIANQLLVMNGNWADPVAAPELVSRIHEQNDQLEMKTDFRLNATYPNPFNSSATFQFYLPSSGVVRLRIYNIRGQLQENISSEANVGGEYEIIWQANGRPSGIYLYQADFNRQSRSGKIILSK